MSHVVHCWNFPTPQSLLHARQVFDELPRSGRPQNRLFLDLAQQLTARHPCITKLAVDDPAAAWSDGPLNGIGDGAVFSLGLRSERLDEVHPFVVETATTLGLVVYDEQRAEVYLPGGTTLTHERHCVGHHLGLPLTGPLNGALVERTLMDALLPLLASEGFERNRAFGGLWRSDADGTQSLRLNLLDGAPGCVAFDVDIVLVDHTIRKVVESLLKAATQGREKHVATAIGSLALACRFFRMPDAPVVMLDDASLRFELRSIDALRTFAIALRWLVADHLRPKLDAWRDPEQIAISLFDSGFDSQRSVGSLVRSHAGGITSALIGGRLLDTRRCGSAMTRVVVAAGTKAPMLQDIIDQGYRDLDALLPAAGTVEKNKLDLCMAALREAGLVS